MSRPPVKKRSGKKLDEAALIRRLAGALPLSSATAALRSSLTRFAASGLFAM